MPCILVQGYLCTLPEVPPNLQLRTDLYFAAQGNIFKCGAHPAGLLGDKKRAAADAELTDEKAQAKKFKATELAPSKATKAVWSSIFLSSRPEEKETYGCRALSSRGWA